MAALCDEVMVTSGLASASDTGVDVPRAPAAEEVDAFLAGLLG